MYAPGKVSVFDIHKDMYNKDIERDICEAGKEKAKEYVLQILHQSKDVR